MRSTTIASTLIGAALLALSACAVGPDYHPSQALAKADFAVVDGGGYGEDAPLAQFWSVFGDPTLSDLIGRALRENHDLRIAVARLNEARALRREAFYDYLPTVTAVAAHTEALQSRDQFLQLPRDQRKTSLSSAGFDAFWELDFFGRVRRENESAKANEQALEADLGDAQNSVAAEVARAYFELRGSQQRLAVAERNADNQAQTLVYTQARLDAGRSTEFDTERAKAQLDATRAIVPSLQAAIAVDEHRIAVLTGQAPSSLHVLRGPAAALPELPHLVKIGLPEDLLRRRPDVRAAERRLAAASADIGVATAELFPVVTFSGEVGFSVHSLSSVGKSGSEYYRFGPSISWAAFDLGRVRARVNRSRAQADGAAAFYEKTVLIALEETENALVAYSRGREHMALLDSSRQASERAAQLARLRYEEGASDFLDELDAERSQLTAEDQFAEAQIEVATSLVALYKALDGGWLPEMPARQAATVPVAAPAVPVAADR
jgi:multidrug efflux system outer membrane protein